VFENYGGSYQLRIRTAEDLAALEELDEPFWMATSAPVDQLTCDPVLLRRLDRDGNGRIQSWELRQGARWLLHMLRNRQAVTARSDVLDLESLDRSDEDGQHLYDTAKRVLRNLGQGDGTHLSLTQVRHRKRILAQGAQNGDGVIPPESVPEEDLRAFVEDIVATVGSVPDLSGTPGTNRELLDTFLENSKALLAWHEELEQNAGGGALLPFGADMPERYELYARLAPTINAYFRHCQVVAFNETLGRASAEAPCPEDIFLSEERATEYLAQAPLAQPRADGVLALGEAINPFYTDALAELAQKVLAPLLGDGSRGGKLDEQQWQAVKRAFAAYEHWLESKSGGQVESLGLDKLQRYTDSDLHERLGALIEADLAAGKELEALHDLEYLILLQRWFLDLCNNFVSFPYLYHPEQRAMFEMGRLVLGGTIFNFNARVSDVNAHSAVAARSGIYLLYSEVTGASETEGFFIVTPVTSGPLADLGVGKRGVLFDPAGREWDTRVVKVVENPVNIREAIAAPFKRIAALIASAVERITSGAEQQLQTQITQATTSLETGIKEGIAPAPAEAAGTVASTDSGRSVSGMRDLVLAGGVVVAVVGSSFAFIASTFASMDAWDVLAALGVGLAIILIPTILIASLRLRRRNLSAVLEASGWAINAPMRLTGGLSRLLVHEPVHPKSFRRLPEDLTRALARAIRSDRRP